MILQIDEVANLLNKEGVTAIGVLLAVVALLIWDKVRQEKRHQDLLNKYGKDQEDNKEMLIEMTKKSITAMEQNTTAINSIRDVYANRN